MAEMKKEGAQLTGCDYKEVAAGGKYAAMYLDGYQDLGWTPEEAPRTAADGKKPVVVLRRERRIANKTELTRLQRHFEACMDEIMEMERTKTSAATAATLVLCLVGMGFGGGATIASTATPPNFPLCVILSVPALICWVVAPFLYGAVSRRRARVVAQVIEQKCREIDEVCAQGRALLE